jgi:2-polyprenyl-3-methyl-5-hydroxy-6-metoxy-1,4-benzoquinol methylase
MEEKPDLMLSFSSIDELKSKLSTETIKAYTELWGDGNELNRFLIDSYVNKSLIEYIDSRRIIIKGKNILEFGCRDGSSFVSFLNYSADKIVGMDIDEKVIDLSKRIYSDLGYNNIKYRINKINEPIPSDDEEFDIVSCNAVFEHINPELRLRYLKELQSKVKKGGYIIISDTPNRLWPKEGHTTGIWFLNYLPFKMKCRLGSMTKRYRDIKPDNYSYWIEQGIVGVTYNDLLKAFDSSVWSNEEDLAFKNEYKRQIFNDIKRSPLKSLVRYFLYFFAIIVDSFYLKPKKYPSLAISPSLIFSFKKK